MIPTDSKPITAAATRPDGRPWLLKALWVLGMLLALGGVFAWYFHGTVPFDMNQLWALCASS